MNSHIPSSSSQSPMFLGAPVAKAITIVLVAWNGFLFLNPHYRKQQQHATYGITSLVSNKFTFGSTGEFVLATMALALQLRRFEREMGSRKFLTFLLFTNFLTTVLECLIYILISNALEVVEDNSPKLWHSASGPYPWLGAMIYMYTKFTPRLHPNFISILGLSGSEKSVWYFLVLNILWIRGSAEIVSTLIPIFIGAISMATLIQFAPHLDLPNTIVNSLQGPVERFGSFFLFADAPPPVYSPLTNNNNNNNRRNRQINNAPIHPAAALGGGGGGGGGGHARRRPVAPPPPPPPSEEAIEQLTAMGFERSRVLDALQQSHNNVERAADRLLSS